MPCSLGWAWAGTGSSGGWSSAQKLLQIMRQMPPTVVEVGLLCFGVSETPSPLPSAASSSVQGACLPGRAAPRRCPGLGPNPHPKPTTPSPPAILPAHLGQRGPAGGSTLPSLLLLQPHPMLQDCTFRATRNRTTPPTPPTTATDCHPTPSPQISQTL